MEITDEQFLDLCPKSCTVNGVSKGEPSPSPNHTKPVWLNLQITTTLIDTGLRINHFKLYYIDITIDN